MLTLKEKALSSKTHDTRAKLFVSSFSPGPEAFLRQDLGRWLRLECGKWDKRYPVEKKRDQAKARKAIASPSIVSRSRKLTDDGYPYEPSCIPIDLPSVLPPPVCSGFIASLFSHSEHSVRFLFCPVLFLSVTCFLSPLTISITRSIPTASSRNRYRTSISRETDLPLCKLFYILCLAIFLSLFLLKIFTMYRILTFSSLTIHVLSLNNFWHFAKLDRY